MQQTEFRVEMWPVDRPLDYPNNPRRYTDADVDEMVQVLMEFGFRQPIVVDAQGIIVVGHRRRMAARRLGLNLIPVHQVEDLEADKIRALRVVDNKVHKGAGWDKDRLKTEIEQLVGKAPLIGFKPVEIAELLKTKPAAALADYPITARLNERYDYVVIAVENETDWLHLQHLLELGKARCYKKPSNVGVGRVVPFARFMALVDKWKGTPG